MSTRRLLIPMLLFLLGVPWLPARNRAAARKAYQRARHYHEQLLQIPPEKQNLRRFSRAIFLYRRVIDYDPTYGAADDALFAVAGLYEEMARRFKNANYRRKAIYYYEFVAREYPTTRHRRTARQNAARLRHPPTPRPLPAPSSGKTGDYATVSDVRYWSNQDYTRVVIQADREISFRKHVLSNPDRIYFDLQSARLLPSLEGRVYDVNDLFIKQIRVAENRPGVVRVVLDFERINRHTVFALYDPFRIVIDTAGDPRARPESSSSSSSSPTDPPSQPRAESTPAPVVPAPGRHGDRSLTRVLGLKVGRVVLDPGHGGRDTGTVGPSGLREKDLVLQVALRLKRLLTERLGTEVILTRQDDRFVPLEERTAIANQVQADLFVSIHANSSRHHRVSGVETFYQGFTSQADERQVASRENASSQRNIRELENLLRRIALGDYNRESRELANVVQSTFYRQLHALRPHSTNRGVKKAPFIVLINLNMPGILVEVGFLSNPSDEKFFRRRSGQSRTAEALYQAIKRYFRDLGALPSLAARSQSSSR